MVEIFNIVALFILRPMKKISTAILTIAAMLCFAACNKEVTPEDRQDTFEFTLNATLEDLVPSDKDTKASAMTVVRLTWKAGDEVSVFNLTTGKALGGSLKADKDGTTTTFSGTLSGTINPDDKLAFLYPSQHYTQECDYQPVTIDLSNQPGSKIDGVPICVYGTTSAEGTATTTASAKFNFLMSYIQFSFANLESGATVKSVDVENIGNSMTLSLTENGFTAVPSTGTIHLSPENYTVKTDGTKAFYMSFAESPAVTSRKITVETDNELKTGSFTGIKLKVNTSYTSIVANFVEIVPMNDPVFRTFCLQNFDINGDGEISVDEAKAVTEIDVEHLYTSQAMSAVPATKASEPSDDIPYLDGIGYFTSLKILNCRENNIGNWDISKNTELEEIWCDGNMVTKLDVSHNTKLKKLVCGDNRLTSLDVSKNTELVFLSCLDNFLTELDLKNNAKLETLEVCNVMNIGDSRNRLTRLDLSNNPALKVVMCEKNCLEELNLSGCSSLETLTCYQNGLENLDLSDCSSLTTLDCNLNIIKILDVSKNTKLEYLKCYEPTPWSLGEDEIIKEIHVNETQEIKGITFDRTSSTLHETTKVIRVPSMDEVTQ